jgi:drug/metabolite transporter (DMT)-like permease
VPTSAPASPPPGLLLGLAAAALFGASTPVAKLLVPGTGPVVLAGLLYLGAGLGLAAAGPLRRAGAEAPLRRSDLPVLAAIVVAGGVAGPVLLVLGLGRLPGVAASLLLNLEAPLTVLLAATFLGERLDRREALGAAAVVAGAVALGWGPGLVALVPGLPLPRGAGPGRGLDLAGVACIAGACGAWAVDNTLSQRLAHRDPVAVARAKALVAGTLDVALGLAAGEALPPAGRLSGALLTGALGYGASMVLFLLAVRGAGAARTAAAFATAPFIGAAVAVPLLGERLGAVHAAAGALMAAGTALALRARHGHPHVHEPVVHEHAHVHDAHHAHVHDGPVEEPHSHPHRHDRLEHDHGHLPDLHHRHGH